MKPIFLTIFALCCLMPVQAQNASRNDSLINREMTLEKEYNPTIRDAVKISRLPELREPQAPKSAVEFSNYTIPYQVQSNPSPLDPQAYFTHLNYSKYRGYLTGGVSSLIDIDGDLGYQILNSDNDRLNVFFSHRSSRSDVSYLQAVSDLQETGKQKFKINDNWGGLNYMHDFGSTQFLAGAKYTYSAFNYYGLSIPLFMYFPYEYYPPKPYHGPMPNNNFDKNTNQINGLFEAHIGLSSEKTSALNYKFNASYTNFQQKYGNKIEECGGRENRLLFDGGVRKMINSTMGIGLSGFVKTYFYEGHQFKILNDSATNYWIYSLSPHLYWEGADMNLSIGAKVEVEVGGREKMIVSPTIRFNYYPSNRFMFYLLAAKEYRPAVGTVCDSGKIDA